MSREEKMAILAKGRVAAKAKRAAQIASGVHPTFYRKCTYSDGGKPRVRMPTGKIDPKTGLETYVCKVVPGSKRGNVLNRTPWQPGNGKFRTDAWKATSFSFDTPSPSYATPSVNVPVTPGATPGKHTTWIKRDGTPVQRPATNAQAKVWGWTRA